jgi:K+-sensing histidine kinase KdpD
MIEKVLYGLLENALSHGKKLTRIRIFSMPSETGCLLVVEDDGVGVPAGLKEKIFAKKVGKEGGLGLFLSREILGITGITVAESGTPGEGARFELAIPSGKFQIKSPE